MIKFSPKAASLLYLATACVAQTTGTGAISGVVRDAATGVPVAQAEVSLQLPDGRSISSPVDGQGQYSIDGLPAGSYRINAAAAPDKGQMTPVNGKSVKLAPGQKLTSVDLRLPSIGIITGRVLDENQQPVSGAQVFRVEKRYEHGALWYAAVVGVYTDETGFYRLIAVPSGESFVVETQNESLRTAVEGDAPANTFYPSVLSADLAAEIVLSPGETRNGVDIHRAELPTYCVAGSVEGAAETPLDLKLLDTAVNGQHALPPNAVGKTTPGGAFRLCGLHRGEYLLTASGSSPSADHFPFFAAETVNITNHDIRDVKLLHSAMSPLSAEFIWDGDPATQPSSIKGLLSLQARSGGFNLAFTVPGSFSSAIPLQPDHYAIDVLRGIDGPGQYLKEITCGGQSVLHGTAQLGGAISCGTLRFVIAHDGGSLMAHVADKDGNPVSDAYVAIIPESAATEGEMSALMTVGQTGADGVYSALALAPGKYRVLATNQTIDLFANHVDKLWTAQSRAREVEIGANANVQVKLEPQTLQ